MKFLLRCLLVMSLFPASRMSSVAQSNAVGGKVNLSAQSGSEATNSFREFQGFHVGDIVRVKVQKPLVVLARARVLDLRGSNVVVSVKDERFTFSKALTTFSDPGPGQTGVVPRDSERAVSNPISANAATVPVIVPHDLGALAEGARRNVLGGFASDQGYSKANSYNESTLNAFLNGQVSLDNLVKQSENVLQEVDRYTPERAHDPRFESHISTLRDFVRRAKAGETVNPNSNIE